MPHMFTNHPRLHNLTRGRKDLKSQFLWEAINAELYKIGGVFFIVGSICFFPKFEAYADLGAWIFFVGSLIYLFVTFHDFLEVKHFLRTSNHYSLKKSRIHSCCELFVGNDPVYHWQCLFSFRRGVFLRWRLDICRR